MHKELFCYIIFGFKSNLLVAGQVSGLKSMCVDVPQKKGDEGHIVNIITDVSDFHGAGAGNLAIMSVGMRQGSWPTLASTAGIMSGSLRRAC
jgi:hypothetical protein